MRTLVIQSPEPATEDGALVPIGRRDEIMEQLAIRNTGPEVSGGNVLHGPGIRLEFTPDEDPVTQILLEIVDEDIAWDVLPRISRELHWSLLDTMTGQSITF